MMKAVFDSYKRRPKTFTFLIAFFVLCVRIWERFLFPGLWAEDGLLFLREAIMLEGDSFIKPYAGYFHTLPRLIAYLTYLFFPVITYPYVIMISCIIFYAFTISRIAGEEFSSLIPSDLIRFLLSISLCMVPGLYEVLGNLANLHWILFLYFCILSIRSLNSFTSYWEIIFIFFVCASTGEPVVLLPVLGLRFIFALKTKKQKIIAYNSIILLLVFFFSVLNYTQKSGLPTGKPSTSEEILIAANFTWNQYFMFQPVLGDKKVAKFYDHYRVIYRYSGFFLGLAILGWTFRKKFYIENFLFPVLLSVFLVPILTWIVRPGSLLSYINVYNIWDWRYSFILSPWGLILWVITIYSIPIEKWRMRILYIFFAAYILNAGYRFPLAPYNKSVDWFHEYKPVEQALKTGCPNKVSVPIHPVLISPILGTETKFYFSFELDNGKNCQ